MPLVLRVEEERVALELHDQVRYQRLLGSEIRVVPMPVGEVVSRFRPTFTCAPVLNSDSAQHRLHPSFEEDLHGHCPRNALQVAQARQSRALRLSSRLPGDPPGMSRHAMAYVATPRYPAGSDDRQGPSELETGYAPRIQSAGEQTRPARAEFPAIGVAARRRSGSRPFKDLSSRRSGNRQGTERN